MIFLYKKRQEVYLRNMNLLKLDHEKNLLKTQMEIQEQTFQSISREIHDNVNHSLILAKLNLNTLLWDNIAAVQESIVSTEKIVGQAISDLSDLSKSMRPGRIVQLGLNKAIESEVDLLRKMDQFKIDYSISGEIVFLDSETELILFRIVQEALNNIVKHAEASRIQLELNYKKNLLEMIIKDNGKGFNPSINYKVTNNSGLKNIKDRAELLGGEAIILSTINAGSEIKIIIPIL
jgi:signal transduction histidine kinase